MRMLVGGSEKDAVIMSFLRKKYMIFHDDYFTGEDYEIRDLMENKIHHVDPQDVDMPNKIENVKTLERRLRKANHIIAMAYRHTQVALNSGSLAYAICKPLLEILTSPLEGVDEPSGEFED